MTKLAAGAVLLIALTVHATSAVGQEAVRFTGLSLAQALRALQAQGLRIVFSSAIVPPELRVTTEPRAAAARQQLDELLAQHRLEVREGPGGTLQVVRATIAATAMPEAHGAIRGLIIDAATSAPLAGVRVHLDGHSLAARSHADGRFALGRVPRGDQTLVVSTPGYLADRRSVTVDAGQAVTLTIRLSAEARQHHEYVSVRHPMPFRTDPGNGSEMTLDRAALGRLDGSLAEDPLRTVHAFPRVAAVDDFRSDFAVRGSPFRHVQAVVDGMPMDWLQHTAYGRVATGSIPMVSGRVVESATLRSGAYRRRHGDRLGSELELTLREGSRADHAFSAAIAGTDATLLGEGPIGAGRGSWLVAARQSYLEWPPDEFEATRTAFGFSDVAGKVVLDVHPAQQLGLTVLGGLSRIDEEDSVEPAGPARGGNRASAFSVSWRTTHGPRLVIRQQAYLIGQRFVGRDSRGRESHRVDNRQFAYRAEVVRAMPGGLLEAGAQLGQTTITDALPASDTGAVRSSAWVRSGFAHFMWSPTRSLTLSPGLRLTSSTLTSTPTLSRWLLAEWSFRPEWSLTGSAGVSRQLPDPRHVLGEHGTLDLRPERASLLDAGLEWRPRTSLRWQLTVFGRREADILREPDHHPRLESGRLLFPDRERYSTALGGRSRGIELLVDRRTAVGLSGWASYAYGRTRYTDSARAESYWSDFDQRHSLTLFARYRFAATAVGATYRAGSGFPVPGYLAERHGRLFAADRRNQLRLPAYRRLDLRADRQFRYFGRRVTPFIELLNVLNRTNLGVTPGSVHPVTGEAIGFTGALLPRRISAGISVDFND